MRPPALPVLDRQEVADVTAKPTGDAALRGMRASRGYGRSRQWSAGAPDSTRRTGCTWTTAWLGRGKSGVPTGIRTPVTAVKGRCPRPLDDGDCGYRFKSGWWR